MSRYTLVIVCIFLTLGISQDIDCLGVENGSSVCLTFGEINPNDGTLEIYYNSLNPIYGFQFNLSGISVQSGYSEIGDVYTLETSGFIMGFLSSEPLPASENGLLVTVNYTPTFEIETCMSDNIIGGTGGTQYDSVSSGCITIPTADLDCMLVYGGSAFIDECGICSEGTSGHSENSDMDECGECFGNGYNQCDNDSDGVVNINDSCPNDPQDDIDQDGLCSDLDPCPLDFSNDADEDGVCESDEIFGCTDISSCNYDPMNTEEDGSCWYPTFGCECEDGYGSVIDNCNVCDTDVTNDCTPDCAGVWGGDAVIDDCGICNGNNQSMDDCGVCFGDNSSCQAATVQFGQVNELLAGGSIEVLLTNSLPIGGFQFEFSGIEIDSIVGGTSQDSEFVITHSSSMVIGYSLGAGTILSVNEPLFQIYGTFAGGSVCFQDVILSSSIGQPYEVELGECWESTNILGCTDESACNFDPFATLDDESCYQPEDNGWCDCDGSIIDCTGDCGGNIFFDQCGECGGDNSTC